jgi:TatD DNase family protein
MELFDTHCHLDVEAFQSDREQVLNAARAAGVRRLLVPAIKLAGWQHLWNFCKADSHLYPAIGLHPVLLNEHKNEDVATLDDFVTRYRPVAIGEIGLDYFVKELDRERQQQLLDAQLTVAEKHRLPVVLHVRKAHDPMLQTLKRYALIGGTCHAFNGSLQQAHQYIGMGFKLGFGGMLTYPNANKLHALARELPMESIVLETDAPDMTGAAHRYQRNSPAYLPEACEMLARLRDMTPEQVAEQTTANACECFDLGTTAATP